MAQKLSRPHFDRPLVLAFSVWALMLLWLASGHMAWRDEFQSWSVATQTQNWTELWMAMRYERTPPLLYLWQRFLGGIPWVKALEPEWGLRLSTLPVTLGFGWLWFFGIQGLTRWERVLVPFSVFVFREYGVISRCYVVGLFLSAMALVFQQARRSFWVIVFLLLAALTHTIWFLVSYGILSWWIWDQRRYWRWQQLQTMRFWVAASFFALVTAVLFFNQLPPADSHFVTGWNSTFLETLSRGLSPLGRAFLGIEWSASHPFRWNQGPFRIGQGLGVLCILIWVFPKLGISRIRYFSIITPALLVFGGAYGASHRQAGILWITLWWVALFFPVGTRTSKWRAAFAIFPVCALAVWIWAWKPWLSVPAFDHSGSRDVVTFSRQYAQGRQIHWMSSGPWQYAILGRIGSPILEADANRWIRYPLFLKLKYPGWAETCQARTEELKQWKAQGIVLAALQSEGGPPPSDCGRAEKIFETKRRVMTDEHYAVYRLW